jgi:hypothetical protein
VLADDRGPALSKPVDLQLDRAHTARIYDYYLGGKDNYEADRVAARAMEQIFPYAAFAARANRAFMHRATRYLAEHGIRQFLDIGTGIPTTPNLHQIAQNVAPEARVVYVDNDPLVLAHARALLVSSPEGRTAYISADATTPEAILRAPQLADTLNLAEPVALSLYAILHFVSDGRDPDAIVRTLMDALPAGSYLVLSHATSDHSSEEVSKAGIDVYHSRGIDFQPRSRDEFSRFFDGLGLIEPGVVGPHRWHPIGGQPPKSLDPQVAFYAGMARK